MGKRVFLFVIDGLGVGASEDAHLYGDENSNTLKNVLAKTNVSLPTLSSLGMLNLVADAENKTVASGSYAKMRELSKGKDTTTGHFEMMGIVNKQGMLTYPNGFPKRIVDKLENAFGAKLLGNCVASGTKIIEQLGDEHIKTGCPIVYTSADSVLQIACHTDVVPLQKLYEMCERARDIMCGEHAVGRVIARPFATINGRFERLNNDRKDFALVPDKNNTMQRLVDAGKSVFAVGKIFDIFAGKGITDNFSSHNNADALDDVNLIANKNFEGLVFINLVDTDMLYGHRNDFDGYAKCLKNFDYYLNEFLISKLSNDDVVIIVGDHGNDPTTVSTDHSREFTPMVVFGKNVKSNIDLGTIDGFDIVGKLVEEYLLNKAKSQTGEKIWKI